MQNLEMFMYLVDIIPDSENVIKKRRAYRTWLARNLRLSDLRGEELLLACYLKYIFKYQTYVTDKSLEAFCKTDLARIVTSNKILVTGAESLGFSDSAQVLAVVEQSKRFLFEFLEESREKHLSIEDFIPSAQIYLSNKLAEGIRDMYTQGSIVLDSFHKDHGTGAYDALRYHRKRLRELDSLYGDEAIVSLVEAADLDERFEFVMDFGIAPLDAVFKGLYTSEMVSIESGPGIGKTKFTCGHIAWRAAVVFKKNVVYFNLEQKKVEIEANLIARHYYYLYGKFTNEQTIRIATEFENLPVTEQQKINAARFDLFESGKYGRINIKAIDLESDTIIPIIETENDLFDFHHVVVVDYIGIVDHPKDQKFNDKEYIVIGDVLKSLKRFGRKTGALIIAVQQQTKEGAERAQKEQMSQPDDAQGGMIAYRSPDKSIIIWRTDVMKAQNKRGIKISKSRGSEDSLSTICDTILGSCIFYTNPNDLRIS